MRPSNRNGASSIELLPIARLFPPAAKRMYQDYNASIRKRKRLAHDGPAKAGRVAALCRRNSTAGVPDTSRPSFRGAEIRPEPGKPVNAGRRNGGRYHPGF
ncbi:MAG: hypothetical protein HSCHL_1181 [Hydrogenibacillus schlegelii]|uniref:Uncharacterized protein n=1 Tax=Hydrogenibacillus schlegelii TaxID=1484 RepID=A0A2T5G6G3_HYDSH|nr:MAG: hypothetical protein HSCHL_1181 [Hydrogenibacillus schlegelii]